MRSRPALALLFAACGTAADSHTSVPARWESRAPVPEGRTEVSVAADDSLIYLIGGYGRGEGRRPAAPRAMLVYDPAADRWTSRRDSGRVEPLGARYGGGQALHHRRLPGEQPFGYRRGADPPSGPADLAGWGSHADGPRGSGRCSAGGRIHASRRERGEWDESRDARPRHRDPGPIGRHPRGLRSRPGQVDAAGADVHRPESPRRRGGCREDPRGGRPGAGQHGAQDPRDLRSATDSWRPGLRCRPGAAASRWSPTAGASTCSVARRFDDSPPRPSMRPSGSTRNRPLGACSRRCRRRGTASVRRRSVRRSTCSRGGPRPRLTLGDVNERLVDLP